MLDYIKSNYIPNTNIIDLGANIGTTTLLMSEVLSENCKIYSFEPLYDDILYKNIVNNNLTDKVDIFSCGIGNDHSTLKIKKIDLFSNINFGAISLKQSKSDEDFKEINIIPLDSLDLSNISLIKIDVEHMEIEVLEGCINLLTKYKPTIIIETYQLETLEKTEIFKKLSLLGYKIEPIKEGYFDFIMKIKI